jgi:hypothetical protein
MILEARNSSVSNFLLAFRGMRSWPWHFSSSSLKYVSISSSSPIKDTLQDSDGAIIVTRYVYQLDREKNHNRQTRQGLEEAFRLEAARSRYSALPSSQELELLGAAGTYDPYQEVSSRQSDVRAPTPRRFETFKDNGRPSPPLEVGYGGGTWTHEEISEEEKARLKRRDREMESEVESLSSLDEAERKAEIKAVGTLTPSSPVVDEPPRYSNRV